MAGRASGLSTAARRWALPLLLALACGLVVLALPAGAAPTASAPAEIQVDEGVSSTDAPTATGPVAIDVDEGVSSTDAPTATGPADVGSSEPVATSDAVSVAPPASVSVGESVSIGDAVSVVPPAGVNAAESVSVGDAVSVEVPVSIPVAETADVSDEVSIVVSGDVRPPVVNVSFPTPNGSNGWFVTSPVVGSVTADDATTGGSTITGITCTGATVGLITGLVTPSASAPVAVSSEGAHNISCTATDSAGNNGAASGSSSTATVQIDSVAPSILITSPANGGTYLVNAAVTSSYSCADTTSGVADCTGPVASGANFSTSPLGTHAFIVNAADVAGNPAQVTNSYSVVTDCRTATRLVGAQTLARSGIDVNAAGSAESFLATASSTGTAAVVCVYVDAANTATQLTAGIYADHGGHPGSLLAQGALIGPPTNGAVNTIVIPPLPLVAGTKYWISVLSPYGSPGTFRFRDHCCGYQSSTPSGPSENSKETNLTSLPATWKTGKVWPHDGPLLGWGGGTTP